MRRPTLLDRFLDSAFGCGALLGVLLLACLAACSVPAEAPNPAPVARQTAPDAVQARPVALGANRPVLTAPRPVLGAGGIGTALVAGNAGYAVPSLGANYLATRFPRGTVVTVTGPGGSWLTATTDYGPDPRIRPVRVADIALGHWLVVCGKPKSAGLCFVEIETGTPALPATDSAP